LSYSHETKLQVSEVVSVETCVADCTFA